MAKYKLTLTYPFQYRFQCEHCEQTTNWKNACFKSEVDTDADKFEHPEIEKTNREVFLKFIPKMHEEVDNGEYKEIYQKSKFGAFEKFDSRCPKCNKYQSWQTTEGIGLWIFAIAVSVGFALFGWFMRESGAEVENGKRQLVGIVIGLFGVIAFLSSLIFCFQLIIKKNKINRDIEKVNIKQKPEFSWPSIEKVYGGFQKND